MNSPQSHPTDAQTTASSSGPKWGPLTAVDRRVLGVLIEKAKTTPDAYPLSSNALRNGCNQKSNRSPQMDLDDADIEDAMERLRLVGAAVVIQGGHRVDKVRHLAYEWLGVDKTEIAVMAELLLRGAQSIGELRARAARMEPIPGLTELRPILSGLVERGLVTYLTPPGRGAIVTHNLYLAREMEKLQGEHGDAGSQVVAESGRPAASTASQPVPATTSSDPPPAASRPSLPPHEAQTDSMVELEQAIVALREELVAMKRELAEVRDETRTSIDAIRNDLDDLNRALGNL